MRKLFAIGFLAFILIFSLGCSNQESLETPFLSLYTEMQNLSDAEFFDEYIDDNELFTTVEWQRNLIGNSYLLRTFEFEYDIFESNNRLILSEKVYDSPIFINITEEQFQKIENTIGDEIVIEFEVTNISPLPIIFRAEAEYDIDFKEKNGKEVKIIKDAYPYIDVDFGSRIISASCVKVYTLEDILK